MPFERAIKYLFLPIATIFEYVWNKNNVIYVK